jgi:hypothetical protein
VCFIPAGEKPDVPTGTFLPSCDPDFHMARNIVPEITVTPSVSDEYEMGCDNR